MIAAQKLYWYKHLCIHRQNVCSLSINSSDRNSMLLFVKRNLAKKYRYTDWLRNFGTQEVSGYDKSSQTDTRPEIMDAWISISASAATMEYGRRNSVFPLVSLFCA
jgi:hypothetical protein